jgi:hypothetical protein
LSAAEIITVPDKIEIYRVVSVMETPAVPGIVGVMGPKGAPPDGTISESKGEITPSKPEE